MKLSRRRRGKYLLSFTDTQCVVTEFNRSEKSNDKNDIEFPCPQVLTRTRRHDDLVQPDSVTLIDVTSLSDHISGSMFDLVSDGGTEPQKPGAILCCGADEISKSVPLPPPY